MPSFVICENGAVTADYVVVSAGLVGLAVAVISSVSSGVDILATDLNVQLQADGIASSFHEMPTATGITTHSVDYTNWTMTNSGTVQFTSSGGTDADPGYILTIDDPGYIDFVDFGPEFTGDQSNLIEGSISFDMNMLAGGGGMSNTELLRITGANGTTLIYTPDTAVPAGAWESYNITLSPSANWTQGNGDPVDSAIMEAVLSDVYSTEMRADQRNGYEELAIDNVQATRTYRGLNYSGS